MKSAQLDPSSRLSHFRHWNCFDSNGKLVSSKVERKTTKNGEKFISTPNEKFVEFFSENKKESNKIERESSIKVESNYLTTGFFPLLFIDRKLRERRERKNFSASLFLLRLEPNEKKLNSPCSEMIDHCRTNDNIVNNDLSNRPRSIIEISAPKKVFQEISSDNSSTNCSDFHFRSIDWQKKSKEKSATVLFFYSLLFFFVASTIHRRKRKFSSRFSTSRSLRRIRSLTEPTVFFLGRKKSIRINIFSRFYSNDATHKRIYILFSFRLIETFSVDFIGTLLTEWSTTRSEKVGELFNRWFPFDNSIWDWRKTLNQTNDNVLRKSTRLISSSPVRRSIGLREEK